MLKQKHTTLFATRILLFLITAGRIAAGESASAPSAKEGGSRAEGKPLVGVYYYPWYRKAPWTRKSQWRQVMRLHLKPPQKPKAGLYDSSDPRVIAEHISQSLRGGIDFWAVSWWRPEHICDTNLRNAILKHPDAHKLKYAILYESTGRLGTFKEPHYRHWESDLAYLTRTYFDQPSYLRIGGRPVLFVYLTREYFRKKGQDALRVVREKFPQIYLAGDDVFGSGYRSAWARNFDAVTAYDVYGQSIGRYGGTRKAVSFLAASYRHAKAEAAKVGTAFMPTVAPGYNDTAVRRGHPGRARYFTDKEGSSEGDIFRAMIRQAALPNLDPRCDRIMIVTSFNEWYEDTQIEATAGTAPPSDGDDSTSGTYYTGGQRYVDYGNLYLDILRQETRGTAIRKSL